MIRLPPQELSLVPSGKCSLATPPTPVCWCCAGRCSALSAASTRSWIKYEFMKGHGAHPAQQRASSWCGSHRRQGAEGSRARATGAQYLLISMKEAALQAAPAGDRSAVPARPPDRAFSSKEDDLRAAMPTPSGNAQTPSVPELHSRVRLSWASFEPCRQRIGSAPVPSMSSRCPAQQSDCAEISNVRKSAPALFPISSATFPWRAVILIFSDDRLCRRRRSGRGRRDREGDPGIPAAGTI